jgi:5-methylthioadenosine/S-adenosylhomocysteine deaminase
LFEEIKLAAILHKGVHEDAALVNAETALTMATVNGARAQGRQGETGVILEGACADVIVLSLDCPGMVPCHNALSATVYAANGSDVCLTMVDGQILYENGAFTTIDWPKLKRQFEKIVKPQLFG